MARQPAGEAPAHASCTATTTPHVRARRRACGGRARPSSCAASCRWRARWPSPSACSSRSQALVGAWGVGGGRAAVRRGAARRPARSPRSSPRSRSGSSSGRIRGGRAPAVELVRVAQRGGRHVRRDGRRPVVRQRRRRHADALAVAAEPRAPGSAAACGARRYWLPEADLVRLGDGVSVNRGCVLQTHLFHDRVMSMSTVDLDHGATMGPHGVILPAASIGADATVGPVVARDARRARAGPHPVGRQPDRPVGRRRHRRRRRRVTAAPTPTSPSAATPATTSPATTSTSTTASPSNQLDGPGPDHGRGHRCR